MATGKRQMLAVLAAAAFASAAHATIDFDVTGLAGTGVTAHVTFTYASTSATDATLRFVIENTTDYSDPGLTDSRITAFAFNIPSIGVTTFTSIAGVTDGASPIELGPPPSRVVPEGQDETSFNEAGWYGLFETNGIKTPNAAGDFDFGVMNAGNANSFITDGQGSGPQILNSSDSNDSTTYLLNLVGTGLDTGDSAIEQAIASALSVPQIDDLAYTFAVRFQGIPTGGSDLATPTPPVVPAPGAAALAAFGLGIVGWVHRRRAR
ncbi:MAG: hypothetical protein V1790_02415 [Planctomycetota bacterium]